MDAKTAKAILVSLVGDAAADPHGINGVQPESLHGDSGPVVIANLVTPAVLDGDITLDGDFTADQLEAIVAWLRDPRGVAEA